MKLIRDHGMIWVDTHPGVWTARGEMFGKPVIYYAAKVEAVSGDGPIFSEDGERIVGAILQADGHRSTTLNTFQLDDADCVLLVTLL